MGLYCVLIISQAGPLAGWMFSLVWVSAVNLNTCRRATWGQRRAFLDWGRLGRVGGQPHLLSLLSREVGEGKVSLRLIDRWKQFSVMCARPEPLHSKAGPCVVLQEAAGPKATGSRARCYKVFVYLKMLETQKVFLIGELTDTLEALWRGLT